LWNTAGVAGALIVLVTALLLWAGSSHFENLVRRRLATQIQNATGGRVEIGSFHWRLLHLEAEAGGIVIHGDEQPPDAPYARIERLRVGLSILGLWSPSIVVRDLEVVRPQIHLIFYPDGETNQPHPKRPRAATHPALEMLFNFQAGRVAVEEGLIDLDNRASWLDVQRRDQPLDFRANDVSLVMSYVPASGQSAETYHVETSAKDLDLTRSGTLRNTVAPVHGVLDASLDLARNAVNLRAMHITGHSRGRADHTLNVSGMLTHFSRPHWQATVNGDVDLALLDPVSGFADAPEGVARVDLAAAGDAGVFRIDGTVNVRKASYVGAGVKARDVDMDCRVHGDLNELRITSVKVRLGQGGEMEGDILLDHWLPPSSAPVVMEAAPAKAMAPSAPIRKKQGIRMRAAPLAPAAPQAPHSTLLRETLVDFLTNGKVNATLKNVPLDTLLAMVSPPPFQRLGVDALLTGPATATWTKGNVGTLAIRTTLTLSPPGQARAGEVPGTGTLDATYTQGDGSVELRALDLSLPASRISAHGRIGAFPATGPTALNVELHTRNLGEFDTALRGLGLSREGKSGTAALPVALGGEADFRGSWAGSLESPRLAGDLKATGLDVELPAAGERQTPYILHWDSVTANGSYDAQHIAVVSGEARRGAEQIEFNGTLTAGPAASAPPGPGTTKARAAGAMPAFNSNSLLHLRAHAKGMPIGDLMAIAGVDEPVTGTLDAQIAADGPVQKLGGSGWAQLNNGTVHGEPVTMLRAQGSLESQVLKLTAVAAKGPGGEINSAGSYDLRAKRFEVQADSRGIDLSKIDYVHNAASEVKGTLGFHFKASGTSEDPRIEGHGAASGLAFEDQALGALEFTAHSEGRTLEYDVKTGLDSASLGVHGQTELGGDYATEARLQFSQFDIATILRLAHVDGLSAQSALSGVAVVQGSLARPRELHGDLRLDQAPVTVAGVHLHSEGGLHATLAGSRLALDPVHIVGEDTDVRGQGSLALDGDQRLDFAASGSVNLKLMETLDRDLTAGGSSTFQMEAHGPLSDPGLRGRVEFHDGSLALEDLPNGLSQLSGVLEFNKKRLEVRSLTAMTGGGLLSFSGYLAYQNGLYSSLSVTGRSIRIRYPAGVSSLADADLQLQGTPTNLLLSGNILLTRFTVSPDLDIAALAAQASPVQAVAPPDAPSNHIRLDVRIRSSPQLNFQNAYAKLAGEVDLRLRGTVATPSLLGRISVTEGNATIAGTRYELQRGDITFSNPVRIQPAIDLTATARVEDYDITLGLHGTPEKMNITYRSDPPLPEADVVALLALGRTQSEQGLYTQQQQQSAGLNPSTDVLLGGALNATVSSRVQKLFGAGSVKVDPSYLGALGNSTTRITVEEQLGKNVTLMYATNVDTTAQQLLQAEIAINRHVSLVVARDESGVFSMVIRATRRYR
jgi:translocation and assembly module TamB